MREGLRRVALLSTKERAADGRRLQPKVMHGRPRRNNESERETHLGNGGELLLMARKRVSTSVSYESACFLRKSSSRRLGSGRRSCALAEARAAALT